MDIGTIVGLTVGAICLLLFFYEVLTIILKIFDLIRGLSYSIFGWPEPKENKRSFVPGDPFDNEFSKAKGLENSPALMIDNKKANETKHQ